MAAWLSPTFSAGAGGALDEQPADAAAVRSDETTKDQHNEEVRMGSLVA
jgi:hypothetical protein